MKVKDLKKLLQDSIENLENYDDEAEVEMVSNTYFLGYCHHFIGISGCDGGYINLEKPVETEEGEYYGE